MAEQVFRIGVLRDVYMAGRHDFGGNAMRMTIDDADLGDRRIELVTRAVERGAGTHGNVAAACDAWDALVHAEQVVGLIGPSTTPVALAVLDRVEAAGVPAIHWAGTDAACSPWQFQYQAGYLPDEGPALAFLMARRGHRRIACFRSEGAYGEAYLHPFIRAARAAGIEIGCEIAVPLEATDIGPYVDAAKAVGADGVVAMGLFGQGVPLSLAIRDRGWEVSRFGNCGFALYAANDPAAAAALAGWVAVDLFDRANPVTADLIARYEARFGEPAGAATVCFARDLATLMIEAVRLAPEASRAGLRAGLEAIRDLPSAAGGAGTRMGFDAQDRLALKGPRIFVFNEITEQGLRAVPG